MTLNDLRLHATTWIHCITKLWKWGGQTPKVHTEWFHFSNVQNGQMQLMLLEVRWEQPRAGRMATPVTVLQYKNTKKEARVVASFRERWSASGRGRREAVVMLCFLTELLRHRCAQSVKIEGVAHLLSQVLLSLYCISHKSKNKKSSICLQVLLKRFLFPTNNLSYRSELTLFLMIQVWMYFMCYSTLNFLKRWESLLFTFMPPIIARW